MFLIFKAWRNVWTIIVVFELVYKQRDSAGCLESLGFFQELKI